MCGVVRGGMLNTPSICTLEALLRCYNGPFLACHDALERSTFLDCCKGEGCTGGQDWFSLMGDQDVFLLPYAGFTPAHIWHFDCDFDALVRLSAGIIALK